MPKKEKKSKKPREKWPRLLSLVRIKSDWAETLHNASFCADQPLLFFGEIPNMPEHGVFLGASGRIYRGLHIWYFEELGPEEV